MNKRDRCRSRLLAVLLALPALQASAQVSPAFEKVLASPSEQQMVLAAARRSAVVEENSCADGRFVIASKVAIYEAPVFDQAGLLRSGVWKQVVEYTGCNSPRSLNVLVTVAQNQRPNARPLFPGDTMADPKQGSDRWREMKAGR